MGETASKGEGRGLGYTEQVVNFEFAQTTCRHSRDIPLHKYSHQSDNMLSSNDSRKHMLICGNTNSLLDDI